MAEGPKKTPPFKGPSESKTFDEQWQIENELLEISMQESIRQRKERDKKKCLKNAKPVVKNSV